MSSSPFTTILRGVVAMAAVMAVTLTVVPVQAAEGISTAPSKFSAAATAERLEAAIKAKEFALVAKVDHAASAAKVDMTLRPTTLFIFGNPRGGTPVMIASQSAGLDLPLKMLVSEDAAGKVSLSWNDPAWIATRHGIDPELPAVKAMTTTLAALAATAGQE